MTLTIIIAVERDIIQAKRLRVAKDSRYTLIAACIRGVCVFLRNPRSNISGDRGLRSWYIRFLEKFPLLRRRRCATLHGLQQVS